jgi:hypothetical protein
MYNTFHTLANAFNLWACRLLITKSFLCMHEALDDYYMGFFCFYWKFNWDNHKVNLRKSLSLTQEIHLIKFSMYMSLSNSTISWPIILWNHKPSVTFQFSLFAQSLSNSTTIKLSVACAEWKKKNWCSIEEQCYR